MAALKPFFFTDPDPELSITGSRDPLGFEVLWTTFGERFIPHLSTVSTGAVNFGVCLTLVWLADSYLEHRGEFTWTKEENVQRRARDGLLVAGENLHTLSVLARLGKWETHDLLGRLNGWSMLEGADGDPLVGPFWDDQMLAKQLAMGIYGRYRSALYSMGLLDESGHLTEKAHASLAGVFETIDDVRAAAWSFFDAMRKSSDCRVALSDFDGAMSMVALREDEFRRRIAPVLRDAMGLTDTTALVARAYDALPLTRSGGGAAREVVTTLLEDESLTDEQHERVADIYRLEEILFRVDWLFNRLWTTDTVGDDEVAPVVDELRSRREDLDRLLTRPVGSGYVTERFETLKYVLEQPDSAAVVDALVGQYHRDVVAKKRGSTEWVTLDGARVVVLNNAYSPADAAEQPGDWRRSYYVDSLRAFKRDLEEVGA